MRDAIGSYWLTMIVIVFIVLFTGYMCLSINMNKSYKVKNEIINIIQKNNGINESTLEQIQEYMTRVGYRTTGKCAAYETAYGSKGRGNEGGNGLFCVTEMTTEYAPETQYTKEQFPKSAYYQIRVFFSIDLPVVRNLFTFGLKGSTKKLFYPVSM
jgi:hypothetical protein